MNETPQAVPPTPPVTPELPAGYVVRREFLRIDGLIVGNESGWTIRHE